MLQNTSSTKSCDDGYVILDDTGNRKSGDATFGTRRQWIGSLGKVDRGQVVVNRHYDDSRKDRPVDHRPYLPQKWVEAENSRQDKRVYILLSKLQLGLELIVKPPPEEDDMELIDVLMTNDIVSDASFLLRSWSFRDKIDKFYQPRYTAPFRESAKRTCPDLSGGLRNVRKMNWGSTHTKSEMRPLFLDTGIWCF